MKQVEFMHLTTEQQKETLWQYGFAIGTRKDNNYAYTLYNIDDFFVEITYEEIQIKSIEAFKGTTKYLQLYPQINSGKKTYSLTKSRLKNH